MQRALGEVKSTCEELVDAAEEDVFLGDGNFELLVAKIDTLTGAVEKLEKRFIAESEKLEAKVTADTRDLFVRMGKVEVAQAVTNTKVLWLVGGASVAISLIVSVVASLVTYWISKG